MTIEELKKEDKLALAEAYRVFEILRPEEKEMIPKEFVNTLLDYADLSLVKPLDPTKKLKDQNLSKQGLYIVMYMCTEARME